MSRSVSSPAAVVYPRSDGRPMAESDLHVECITYVRDGLKWCFERRGRRDVYVGANLFVYYERGNCEAMVAPDVFVVLGARDHQRDSYLLWNEPKGPDFVLEVTSKSTRDEDGGRKRVAYASLGVEEYFLYDPRGEYLTPPLQGYRLSGGGYRALAGVALLPGGGVSVHSEVLGLDVRDPGEGRRLRLHDPATGRDLLTYREEAAARRSAEALLEQEATARRAAEARTAELEARLRDLEGAPASSEEPRPRKPAR